MFEGEPVLPECEMDFPWDEENPSNIWAINNLSNYSSPILSGGAGTTIPEEEEGEEKSEGKKVMAGSSNGINNGKEIEEVQGNNNKKRTRGGVCKKIIYGKSATATTTNDDQNMKEGTNKKDVENFGGGGELDRLMHRRAERETRRKMANMFVDLQALLPQLPPKANKSTIIDEAVNHIQALEQTLQKLQKQKVEKLQGASTSSATSTGFNCKASIISQENVAYNDTREAFLPDQGPSNDLINIVGNNNFNSSNNSFSVVSQSSVMFQTWTFPNVVLNICGEKVHINICSPKKPGLLTSICYVLETHKITVVSAHVSSDGHRNMYMIHAQYNLANAGAPDQLLAGLNPKEEVFKQAVGELLLLVSS